jgi:hypothetical protein
MVKAKRHGKMVTSTRALSSSTSRMEKVNTHMPLVLSSKVNTKTMFSMVQESKHYKMAIL